jgi:hypothetical protein
MTGNARGRPLSSCGTPLHSIGQGRYVLAQPGQLDAGQSEARGSQDAGAGRRTRLGPPLAGLQAGPFRFADWPDDQVPRRAAGVYTIWRGDVVVGRRALALAGLDAWGAGLIMWLAPSVEAGW